MMSLAPVSVHQGRHYYQQDNYYTRGEDVEHSEWFGRGAAELGLAGGVRTKDFDRLLMGVDPVTGRSLTGRRTADDETNRRAGLDLTFSAPKSVSLAAFLGKDARLEAAHQRAVDTALKIAEERYSMTRSGGQQDRQTELAGNFIAAKFRHDTSRAKDPQLHTHCVVLNAVRRGDGEWRSLSNEALYANSKLLSLVYRNELAREVQALGYSVTTREHGMFEIEGYSQKQLDGFSKRRKQLEALGAETPEDAQRLVKINRPAKGEELPRSALEQRWQSEADALGIEHPRALTRGERNEIDHGELVRAGMRHATERDVSFRREELERFALEANLGRVSLAELDYQFKMARHRGDLMEHAQGHFTTRAAIEVERRMQSLLEEGKAQYAPIVSQLPDALESKGLSAGQKEALEKSLTSSDQFLAWQGVAGAGKTFAMTELKAVCEASGVTVRGFAPSAEAAKVLADETKLVTNTVAGFLTSQQSGRDRAGREMWIVDEAGLLSARDAAQLMERARAEGARMILVGDTRQLSSVEAGNPFKLLQQAGITTGHLTESRRQKTESLKEAAAAMARGEIREGLGRLGGDIIEFARESTRVRHAASQYLALKPEERSKILVLAGTNREREALTAAIREGLSAEGTLGVAVTVKSLRAKDLTREEAAAGRKIAAGDVLIYHKDYSRLGIAKGEQLEVVAIEGAVRTIRARRVDGSELEFRPTQAPAFLAYEVADRELAVGDQVRWTKNEHGRGLRNGQGLQVAQINEKSIVLAGRGEAKIECRRNERLHVDHDYVHTVYASQGKTSDRVIISADKTFGKEAMYVAVTRAKLAVTLYTEDKKRMVEMADVSRAKASAMDLMSENQRQSSVERERLNGRSALRLARGR